eukprot:272995-Chlamydomonas_euryale.AAC.2
MGAHMQELCARKQIPTAQWSKACSAARRKEECMHRSWKQVTYAEAGWPDRRADRWGALIQKRPIYGRRGQICSIHNVQLIWKRGGREEEADCGQTYWQTLAPPRPTHARAKHRHVALETTGDCAAAVQCHSVSKAKLHSKTPTGRRRHVHVSPRTKPSHQTTTARAEVVLVRDDRMASSPDRWYGSRKDC